MDLSQTPFSQRFTGVLPGDPNPSIEPRQVRGACYSKVQPTPVKQPTLIGWSEDLARDFQLDRPTAGSESVNILGGNLIRPEMVPFSMCYGGHQFGNWAGQLGDGRAISLGEIKNANNQLWELQLKGAGPTPYSRHADGRAVLRSSIREFLASEAMYYLGVPTTRALSLVGTGDAVIRDMFYDGHPEYEQGAIVARMAPTFLRFGNFEIFASRGENHIVRQMADWVIRNFHPELGEPSQEVYGEWFKTVVERTARLMIDWLRVGFVHGVMNTDNMSILGLTIDYGPYGWLDVYDPSWTPNTTDLPGRRYCYGRQAAIAFWNLQCLAEALVPLFEDDTQKLEAGLAAYDTILRKEYPAMLGRKLGIFSLNDDTQDDFKLLQETDRILQLTEIDMTIFFRKLADLKIKPAISAEHSTGSAQMTSPELSLSEAALKKAALKQHFETLSPAFYQTSLPAAVEEDFAQWLKNYTQRVQRESLTDSARREQMNRVNPKFILRNYIAFDVIQAVTNGDYGQLNELLQILKHPYDEQPEHSSFFRKRPDWAKSQAGCSTLSCSS